MHPRPPKAWSMSAPSPPALGCQSQSSFTSMPLPGVPLALGHLVSPEASKGCTRSPVPPPNSVTVLGLPVDSCPSATAHRPQLLIRPSSRLPYHRDGSHSPQLLRRERGETRHLLPGVPRASPAPAADSPCSARTVSPPCPRQPEPSSQQALLRAEASHSFSDLVAFLLPQPLANASQPFLLEAHPWAAAGAAPLAPRSSSEIPVAPLLLQATTQMPPSPGDLP